MARALVARGIGPDSLNGKIPGRTGKAIYTRVNYLNMTPDKRESRNFRRKCARDELAAISPRVRRQYRVAAVEPPPEVIWEAIQRAKAPRSITAIICGDPPLIASALGKRKAGAST